MADLTKIVEQFENKKILVVGDVMLDAFTEGSARESPEGPHFILREEETRYYPGGAGNVASNIIDLGARAYLCSRIGEDNGGKKLIEVLEGKGINTEFIVNDGNMPTIIKERFVGTSKAYSDQTLLRVDREDTTPIDEKLQRDLMERLYQQYLGGFDAIVVSDYNKGFVINPLVKCLPPLAKDGLTVVDTKSNKIRLFNSFRYFKPNEREASVICGVDYNGINDDLTLGRMGKALSNILNFDHLVMTCGKDGMVIFDEKGDPHIMETIKTKEVYDVSGAGDTVNATLALGLSSGADIYHSCTLAAHAASVVVGKRGTSTCSKEELLRSLKTNSY